MESHPQHADEYEGKTEKITDPGRVVGLLTRIVENRGLLTVSLRGANEPYNSALLELHPDRGYMVLDELNPKKGHQQLLTAREMNVHTRLKGVEISFAARVESVGDNAGIAFYRVALPTTLNYLQRRAYYRARVSVAKRVPVRITRDDGTEIDGELRDISLGGIGIRCSPTRAQSLADGEHIPHCAISLPASEKIACKVDVCFVNRSLRDGYWAIGARFVELSPAQQKRVAEFVATLDRELMKKLQK